VHCSSLDFTIILLKLSSFVVKVSFEILNVDAVDHAYSCNAISLIAWSYGAY